MERLFKRELDSFRAKYENDIDMERQNYAQQYHEATLRHQQLVEEYEETLLALRKQNADLISRKE